LASNRLSVSEAGSALSQLDQLPPIQIHTTTHARFTENNWAPHILRPTLFRRYLFHRTIWFHYIVFHYYRVRKKIILVECVVNVKCVVNLITITI
jgi:hypothetical protein